MKRKGFTLIELLAVIIVLAVIALIAIPIVINVVEKARMGAAIDSAYNYVHAIDKQVAIQKTGIVNIEDGKIITIGDHKVEYFENKVSVINPPDNGFVSINPSGIITDACLEIFNYRVDYDGTHAVINETSNSCDDDVYVDVKPCVDEDCSSTSDEETEETNTWLATYYSVGYVANNDDQEVNYTIYLRNLPIEPKYIYKIELVRSGVMTTLEDFEKYLDARKMNSVEITNPDPDNSIGASPERFLAHAAGPNQLTIDDIKLQCNNTNCTANITETLRNLAEVNADSTVKGNGEPIENVIYLPIKFTVKITKGNIDGYVYPKVEQDLVVSFNTGGGSTVRSQNISYYEKVSRPSNPSRSGYRFITWNLNGVEYDFNSPVTTNITLDAVWEKIDSFTVTFNSNGGTNVSKQTVFKGNYASRPSSPERTGYLFSHWTLNGQTYNFNTPVTEDIVLTAVWDQAFTVTFNTNGGSSISTKKVKINSTVSQPVPPTKYNNVFNYWTLNGVEYDFSTPVTSDITLDAVWRTALVVTFNSNGGTSVPTQYPAYVSRDSNEAIVVRPSNPTKSGYSFVKWQLNGVDFDFSKTINTNITLDAVWEKTYTVTFNSNGGSSVGSQKIVSGGKASQPSLSTRCGYSLMYWTLNGVEYDFNTPVTSDINLVAVWKEELTYRVSFDSNGGTSVSTQCIPANKLASYRSTSRSGYNFLYWSLNGSQYDFSTPVTSDITLKAVWKEKYNNSWGENYVAPTTSYTLTYYTVGYITNTNSQTVNYTVDLNEFPDQYSTFLLDPTKINSIYVKNVSVIEDFTNMIADVGTNVNVVALNQTREWIATDINNIKTYALNSSQVSVEASSACTSGCAIINVSENIADVSGLAKHNAQTVAGKTVDVLYIPLAITIKVEIGEGAALTSMILANNNVQDSSSLDYTHINKYGIDHEQIIGTTAVDYSFLSDHYYWFATDYTFNETTGLYEVAGNTSNAKWGSSIPNNYQYFCGNARSSKTCDVLYKIDSYVDSTTAKAYPYTVKVLEYASNGDGLFEKDGTHFFRGNVKNNYVQFAGQTWRIVRINEDGTIRLVTNDSIGLSKFNESYNDNAYVGFMYGQAGSTNYNLTHANTNSSTVKQYLDSWFESNLQLHSAALADSGFCADRSLYTQNGYDVLDTSAVSDTTQLTIKDTGLGYSTKNTMYGSFYRIYHGEPTYKCVNENDLFSVSKENGNGALTYPIGLLTASDVLFAAGDFSTSNNNYYLYLSGKPWWTMSPYMYVTYEGEVRSTVVAGVDGIYHRHVSDEIHVRPVINLVSNVTIVKGNGTASNPYVIN